MIQHRLAPAFSVHRQTPSTQAKTFRPNFNRTFRPHRALSAVALGFVALAAAFLPSLLGAGTTGPSAKTVLAKVDEIRNPQIDYSLNCSVSVYEPKEKPRDATFEVLIKGQDKTVIRQLTPVNERDRLVLMRERGVWVFFPNVSKPLRMPLHERLTGDIAIGDIARANFSGDYTPTFLKQSPAEEKQYYTLELKAVSEDVTYGRVILWVDRTSGRPVKAEFFAMSGKKLKSCTFENYKSIGGRVRPTRLVMTDAVIRDKKSVVNYDKMDVKPLPEKYFTKDYMKKIQP